MIQELKNHLSIQHLKSNVLFFLSGLCFCLLIFHTEKMWLAVFAACFMAATFLSLFFKNIFSRFRQSTLALKILSLLLSVGAACLFARRFITNWGSARKIESAASHLHLSTTVFISVCAGALAFLSLLFLVLLLNLLLAELKRIIVDFLQVKKPKELLANIKSNVLLIISAFAFLGLSLEFTKAVILSTIVACVLIVVFASQSKRLIAKIREIKKPVIGFSAVSAIGIIFYNYSFYSEHIAKIASKIPSTLAHRFASFGLDAAVLIKVFIIILSALAFFAVFFMVLLLINYVCQNLGGLFESLELYEKIICSLIVVGLICFAGYSFFNSNAFWGTNISYDIIYTSDSPSLVSGNAYLRLHHFENDLRQPLFAVFAAPFVGFGYALSLPFAHMHPAVTPLFMNAVQIVMLVVANLMLAKAVRLNAAGRVCFVLLTSLTYTTLLFSVMMEQYIVVYFWLIFAIYLYVEHKKAPAIALSGAAGTLLTSFALMPAAYEKEKSESTGELRCFVCAVEKSVVTFFIMMLAFARLDVILGFTKKTTQLSVFAGGESIAGRIKQYLLFISSCFIAPHAIVDKTTYEHVSWQLSSSVISQISILGIVLLALCVVSVFVNRKNVLTRISALWICFSMLLLCVVGWGSAENGMVLYSLYFGWAFVVLLFQLIEWCSKKLNFKYLTPVLCAMAMTAMAVMNYRGIKELLSFAFKYYSI